MQQNDDVPSDDEAEPERPTPERIEELRDAIDMISLMGRHKAEAVVEELPEEQPGQLLGAAAWQGAAKTLLVTSKMKQMISEQRRLDPPGTHERALGDPWAPREVHGAAHVPPV